MKRFILLLALLLSICTSSFGQKVPQAAKDAFNAKFPNAENTKWDKENSNEYEANFTLNGTEMSAVFVKDGSWKETETTIDVSKLPQAVLDAVKLNYPSGELFGASRIERADGTTVYETDIKINKKKKEVLFDENGNIIK